MGPDRRIQTLHPHDVVPLRLKRKYADIIDGVDLSERNVGERLCLAAAEARLLLAEGWAEPVSADQRRHTDLNDGPDSGHDRQRCA